MAILEVKRLKISFWTQNGTVKAVRDISFKLEKGKTLAIVGESGSGKSVTSKAILGISAGNVIIESGEIIYDGQDLLRCSEQDMYNIRGDKIAMIFQDPLSSLNPIVRVGKQITEAMILKNRAKRKEAKRDLKNMLHHLHTAMMETKDKDNLDEAKINELINDFKEASLKGGEIETSFNKAKNQVTDVSSKLKDIILRVKHKYQGDLSGQLKAMHRKLTKISDAYFLYGIEEELKRNELLLEKVLLAYKDRRKVASADRPALIKENVAKLTTVQKSLDKILARTEIDFFNLGFYIHKNPEANLSGESFKKINEITKEYIEKMFLPEFSTYIRAALEHSIYKTLEYKRAVLVLNADLRAYLERGQIDKKELLNKIKVLKPVVDNSIEPLKTQKDSAIFILINSLLADTKKYFLAKRMNAREERRFAWQTRMYERKLSRGRKLDYQVAPKKLIALEDILNDMISTLDAATKKYESVISKFGGHKYKKWDKISQLLVDYLKQKAKDSVYKLSKTEAKEDAIKLMEEVAIPEARARFRQYPFEFSGGMRQRIVIAIALSAEPEILICDEPTTALDVTIQAQILELINDLKARRNLSIIFITHDLGVVANMADEVAVMYAGKIVEYGTTDDIFYSPAHPYTWALLSSMPDLDTKEKLESIPGTPPNMIYPPKGDAFAERNKYALKIDFEEEPPMFKISETHSAATWLLDPRAPKVEMPAIIRERIARMKQSKQERKGKKKTNEK